MKIDSMHIMDMHPLLAFEITAVDDIGDEYIFAANDERTDEEDVFTTLSSLRALIDDVEEQYIQELSKND